MITMGCVLLGIGTIAGGFFYYDRSQKSESLRSRAEEIASLTAKISNMDILLSDFRQKASEDERRIEKLQVEIQTMTGLNISLRDSEASNEAIRKEISVCNDAKTALEMILEQERNRVRTLTSTLNTVRNRVLNLEKAGEDKDKALESLKVELSRLETEKISEKADADRRITALEQRLGLGHTKLSEAEAGIQSRQHQIDALSRSIGEMQAQLQQAGDENQRLQTLLKKVRVDGAAKETQISYLIEEIKRTEDEAARRNAQLKNRIQENVRQIEKERAQVLSLRGQVDTDEKTQAFLEKRFFKLHEQKDQDTIEAGEQIAQLKARIAEQEDNIADKNLQLSEKDRQLTSVQSQLAALKTEMESVAMARENMSTDLFQLKAALETEQRLHKRSAAELTGLRAQTLEEQEAAEKRRINVEQQFSETKARLADARTRIKVLDDRVEKDKAALTSLQNQLSDLDDRLRREQVEAAQRNDQLKRLIKEKEIQLEKATLQILNMRASIETAVGVRSAMPDPISDLRPQSRTNINELLTQLDEKIQNKNRQLEDALGEARKWRTLYEDLGASLDLRRDQVETLQEMVSRMRKEKAAAESQLKEMGTTYTHLIRELHDNLENSEATIKEYQKQLTVTFVDKILFGRAAVTISREGKNVLRKAGKVFKNIRYGKIRVVGHTDRDPIRSQYRKMYPSNWELSSARAAAVARFFQDAIGIAPERMEILGMGYTQPVASNETAEGKAKNRRVEIVIIPNR